MTEHRKQTAFLRRIIHLDGTDECRRLEERIVQVERDECCVQRVAWLMALFTLLAVAALAYGAALLENFPYNQARFVIKAICAVGLASVICLVAFLGLLMIYRERMNQLREECRRLVIRLLESDHGRPHVTSLRSNGLRVSDGEVAQSGLDIKGSPGAAGADTVGMENCHCG
ncbi:MAG: hypothetical protein P8Z30_13540 [Acidobacteriota bacterium]